MRGGRRRGARRAPTSWVGSATRPWRRVWPSGSGVYADAMNGIPKVVFSKTLTHAERDETRIASDALAETR